MSRALFACHEIGKFSAVENHNPNPVNVSPYVESLLLSRDDCLSMYQEFNGHRLIVIIQNHGRDPLSPAGDDLEIAPMNETNSGRLAKQRRC